MTKIIWQAVFCRRRAAALCALAAIALSAAFSPGHAQTATQAAPIDTANLPAALDALIDSDPVSGRTFVGVTIIDADSGETLYDRFGSHLFTPASNVKLYSSARALALWGAEHRFETVLAATAPIDAGTIRGDLVLRGGGDPILKSPDLRAMAARAATQLGLKAVEGDLVIDLSRFDTTLKGPGWMWDDDPDAYQMSVTPLMLDYNVMTVSAQPDATAPKGVRVSFDPPSDYPPAIVTTTAGAAPGALRIDRKPFADILTVTGPSTGATPATRSLTMHQPGPWVGSVFHKMLIAEGIDVRGRVRVSHQAIKGEELLTHLSAPMPEVLALFNKPSENAIGEVLLHNFAAEAGKIPATWSAGASNLGDWLTGDVGLAPRTFRLVDGSGLSRYNLITPAGTAQLLRHMWQRADRDVYLQSLTIAGVDGTTRSRMTASTADGNIFCKSGTMSGVSCLSGYVKREGASTLIFSILTNGYVGSSGPSRALQDKICVALAESR